MRHPLISVFFLFAPILATMGAAIINDQWVKTTVQVVTDEPAEIITPVIDNTPKPTQKPKVQAENNQQIRCYCNLPSCSRRSDMESICTTTLGCFSEFHLHSFITKETTITTSVDPMNDTVPNVFPEIAMSVSNDMIEDSFGCLELIEITNTCDEILKSTNEPNSVFPIRKTTKTEGNTSRFQCCQDDMCNDQSQFMNTASVTQTASVDDTKKSSQNESTNIDVVSEKNNDEIIGTSTTTSTTISTTTNMAEIKAGITTEKFIENETEKPKEITTSELKTTNIKCPDTYPAEVDPQNMVKVFLGPYEEMPENFHQESTAISLTGSSLVKDKGVVLIIPFPVKQRIQHN